MKSRFSGIIKKKNEGEAIGKGDSMYEGPKHTKKKMYLRTLKYQYESKGKEVI